ncbi:hypothetical protein HDU98_009126 [Podochytrium sp. JEL0797]|nr:hypothetical protein HDU98_009126 [Podochytrium sp. JEL0797]
MSETPVAKSSRTNAASIAAKQADLFEALTVSQLKTLCREWSLPVGGTKPELIARILEKGPITRALIQAPPTAAVPASPAPTAQNPAVIVAAPPNPIKQQSAPVTQAPQPPPQPNPSFNKDLYLQLARGTPIASHAQLESALFGKTTKDTLQTALKSLHVKFPATASKEVLIEAFYTAMGALPDFNAREFYVKAIRSGSAYPKTSQWVLAQCLHYNLAGVATKAGQKRAVQVLEEAFFRGATKTLPLVVREFVAELDANDRKEREEIEEQQRLRREMEMERQARMAEQEYSALVRKGNEQEIASRFPERFLRDWKAQQMAAGLEASAVFVLKDRFSSLGSDARALGLYGTVAGDCVIVGFDRESMAVKNAVHKAVRDGEERKERNERERDEMEQQAKRQRLLVLQSRIVKSPRGWDPTGRWVCEAPEMDNYNNNDDEYFIALEISGGVMFASFGFGYLTGVIKLASVVTRQKPKAQFNWRGEGIERTYILDDQVGELVFGADGTSLSGKIWTDMGDSFVSFTGVRVGNARADGHSIATDWSNYLERASYSRW